MYCTGGYYWKPCMENAFPKYDRLCTFKLILVVIPDICRYVMIFPPNPSVSHFDLSSPWRCCIALWIIPCIAVLSPALISLHGDAVWRFELSPVLRCRVLLWSLSSMAMLHGALNCPLYCSVESALSYTLYCGIESPTLSYPLYWVVESHFELSPALQCWVPLWVIPCIALLSRALSYPLYCVEPALNYPLYCVAVSCSGLSSLSRSCPTLSSAHIYGLLHIVSQENHEDGLYESEPTYTNANSGVSICYFGGSRCTPLPGSRRSSGILTE